MTSPAHVLLLLTRDELVAAAAHLGLNVPNPRRKDSLVATLLEAHGTGAVVAALADRRVRTLATTLGLPKTRDIAKLRQMLLARAEEHSPHANGAAVTATKELDSPGEVAARLEWKTGRDSPNGRRVLDVGPGTKSLLSASTNPDAAANVMADDPPDVEALDSSSPGDAASIEVHWPFTADELVRIGRGFKPSAMEDKWRIVTRVVAGTLRVCFLRSWTNNLVFVLEVAQSIGTRLLYDPAFSQPVGTARAILDGYLLGRPCVLPAPPKLGADKFRLMSYGVSIAGCRCDFVEPAASRMDVSSAASTSPMLARDGRRRGALLGLAVGDALGAAVEFKPRGSFPAVTGYRAGGPHGLGPGEWTDDTSMALALADSMASVGWDLADQARRYVAWRRQGKYSVNGRCFDIGIATRDALTRFEGGANAALGGDAADGSSGNGSIMRLAPVAIHHLDLFPENVRLLAKYAEESSWPTHRSPKCRSACRYLAVVLAALMSGRDRDEVLSPEWPVLAELHRIEPLEPAILEVARGSYRNKEPWQILGNGYVVRSLEAALWAFHKAPTFQDAVLAAVNLGDDADTTGAVCGQLAGAYFGADGIPAEWLKGLAKREWIEDAVRRMGAVRFHVAGADDAPPTERCYWVVPGRLLAGAYPGDADRAKHEARVATLWGAGVRTFVSLMEKNEKNNAGKPFTKYADTVDALAARTGERGSCERFPIRDVDIPSRESMAAILVLIDRELGAGRPVYVHCFGGIGRTGTVVGCWLLRHGLASSDDVMQVLARLRLKDILRATKRSPETDDQIRFMRTWGPAR